VHTHHNLPWLPPLFLPTTAALALVLAWDLSGLDLALARLAGGPDGFALRHDWLLTVLMHDAIRHASWLLAVVLCLGVWWPMGPLTRATFSARLQLAVTTLAAACVVALLKGMSATSCPWDLSAYGGMTPYVPHWSAISDGGPGHCFPAGHASSGFAFLGGFFAFRGETPGLARCWLATATAAGLLLGIGQQLRGAHFMSHTLWSGWLCWLVALVIDRAWPAGLAEQP
jgi:membrane-associated PAP2 superfamily phosphatase